MGTFKWVRFILRLSVCFLIVGSQFGCSALFDNLDPPQKKRPAPLSTEEVTYMEKLNDNLEKFPAMFVEFRTLYQDQLNSSEYDSAWFNQMYTFQQKSEAFYDGIQVMKPPSRFELSFEKFNEAFRLFDYSVLQLYRNGTIPHQDALGEISGNFQKIDTLLDEATIQYEKEQNQTH